jgi:hypothetical protein
MKAEEFARTTAEFLRAQGETRPIVVDEARNRLVIGVPPQPVSFLSLKHAHAEFLETPEGGRERVLSRRFWSTVQRATTSMVDSVSRAVLPRLRDRKSVV